jgi:hypothetical protein
MPAYVIQAVVGVAALTAFAAVAAFFISNPPILIALLVAIGGAIYLWRSSNRV